MTDSMNWVHVTSENFTKIFLRNFAGILLLICQIPMIFVKYSEVTRTQLMESAIYAFPIKYYNWKTSMTVFRRWLIVIVTNFPSKKYLKKNSTKFELWSRYIQILFRYLILYIVASCWNSETLMYDDRPP